MKVVELGPARAWVVADLHLAPDDPAEAEAFAAHLDALPAAAEVLVVLGDLVDAWAGRGHEREAGFRPLAPAFGRLRARGVAVWLLRGNRDVLLEAADAAALGVELADGLLVEAAGRRWLLSHGDEYCLRDRPYQRLRRLLRWRPLRLALRVLPYGLRRRLASRLRGLSRAAVARKPLDALALVPAAVSAALAARGADAALIGHLHRAELRELGNGRLLRVLPAWGPQLPPVPLGPDLTASRPGVEWPVPMSSSGPSEPVPVIALDGLSGSGKSTLARLLASRLGWAYLDSGAWYRALAWAALRDGIEPRDEAQVLALLSRIDIHGRADGAVDVDGHVLREESRSPAVDATVSEVADHPAVRAALTERMRRLRQPPGPPGIVADGRDAGSVIFPDAALKVFIEAELEVRVRRRHRQRLATGSADQLAALRQAMAERDRRDSARGASAPRRLASGHVVDNNALTVEEAIRRLLILAEPLLSRSARPGQP